MVDHSDPNIRWVPHRCEKHGHIWFGPAAAGGWHVEIVNCHPVERRDCMKCGYREERELPAEEREEILEEVYGGK